MDGSGEETGARRGGFEGVEALILPGHFGFNDNEGYWLGDGPVDIRILRY
jgi:hypothetical protein